MFVHAQESSAPPAPGQPGVKRDFSFKLTPADVVFAFLFFPLLLQLNPARLLPKAVRGAFTLTNSNTFTAALLRLHLVLLPSACTDNGHELACVYCATPRGAEQHLSGSVTNCLCWTEQRARLGRAEQAG